MTKPTTSIPTFNYRRAKLVTLLIFLIAQLSCDSVDGFSTLAGSNGWVTISWSESKHANPLRNGVKTVSHNARARQRRPQSSSTISTKNIHTSPVSLSLVNPVGGSGIPLTMTTVWFVLAHVICGALPVPFVVNSTKPGGWYRKISLPSWNPPDKVFAPVWTSLYTCMGIAVSIVFTSTTIPATQKKQLLFGWLGHYLLNLSWAPTFFGRQRLRAACVISYALTFTLGLSIIPSFSAVNPLAGYLLWPYMAWITFATFLNRTICGMNPTTNGYNDAMLQAQIQKLQDDAAAYAGL